MSLPLARVRFRLFSREMGRSELGRLSCEELIELVLRLQRPEKTSRTSSKPPATDRKEQRAQSQARRRQARSRGPQPSAER